MRLAVQHFAMRVKINCSPFWLSSYCFWPAPSFQSNRTLLGEFSRNLKYTKCAIQWRIFSKQNKNVKISIFCLFKPNYFMHFAVADPVGFEYRGLTWAPVVTWDKRKYCHIFANLGMCTRACKSSAHAGTVFLWKT